MESPKRSAPSLPRGFLYIPWYILQSQTFLPHTMDHSHIVAALSAPHGGDAADAAKHGKKRGSYNCGRCGLPKKGHNCTVKTLASTADATPDLSPLSPSLPRPRPVSESLRRISVARCRSTILMNVFPLSIGPNQMKKWIRMCSMRPIRIWIWTPMRAGCRLGSCGK